MPGRSLAEQAAACPTLPDLVAFWAAHQPDAAVFTHLVHGEDPGTVISFAGLHHQARSFGAALQRRCAPGDRVLLVFANTPDFIALFFGCLFAGLIAVPVAPPRNSRGMTRLHNLAQTAGARLAIAAADLRASLQKLGAGDAFDGTEWLFADDLPPDDPADFQAPAIIGQTTAVLQFTSGSTGNQKGVMVSHANILHNCRALQSVCGQGRDMRMVSWMPFFHDWGLIGCMLFPVYAGGSCHFFDPADFLRRPRRWLEAIDRFGATVSCAPNFAYDLCAANPDDPEAARLDLSGWTMAMVGAEPVRQTTIEKFVAGFAASGFRRTAFYPCYGLAENTLIVTGGQRTGPPVYATLDRLAFATGRAVPVPDGQRADARAWVGCGKPLLDQSVLIVAPDTRRPCPPATIGEVWISGPSVTGGYWQRPDETHAAFAATTTDDPTQPYLRSGDLGFMLDGELFLCGRLKDVIIKAGANYLAEDLEHSMDRAHPALRPGCGAAFSVEVAGTERLVVVQELNYGKKPDLAPLIGAIQRAISEDHGTMADAIALLAPGSLEKTSSGKIRRQHTKSLFIADRLDPLLAWKSWQPPGSANAESPEVT